MTGVVEEVKNIENKVSQRTSAPLGPVRVVGDNNPNSIRTKFHKFFLNLNHFHFSPTMFTFIMKIVYIIISSKKIKELPH